MRIGKIARLPRKIRHQLNHRLADGQPAETVLPWLNDLPAVKSMLATDFAGQPISKQNLSQWRTGGFAQWEARQDLLADALDLAEDSSDLSAATRAQLPEHLATVLAARYASLMLHWDGEESVLFPRKLRLLQPLCQAVSQLRRGQYQAARIQLEKDRITSRKKKTDAEIMAQFEEWSRRTDVRDAIFRKWRSPAERKRDIFKLVWGDLRPVPDRPDFSDDSDEYETHNDPEESAEVTKIATLAVIDHPANQGDLATTSLPVNATPNVSLAPHPPLSSETGLAAPKRSEGGSQSVKPSQGKNSEPTVQSPVAEPVTTQIEKQDVPAAATPEKPWEPFIPGQRPIVTKEKRTGHTYPVPDDPDYDPNRTNRDLDDPFYQPPRRTGRRGR